ncbi:MAG TPA: GPW/gp25 family protein [Nakamurella sp.]|nr:GPW/gp25 family protein [Nakamurella sp.]
MTTTSRVDIAYPYAFDGRGRTATANYGDHVRQMIEQLLLTNPGERVNRPEFGGGLLQLVFEAGGPERAAAVELALSAAVATWLGDVIDLQALSVTSSEATLLVQLDYMVRPTGERRSDIIEAAVTP